MERDSKVMQKYNPDWVRDQYDNSGMQEWGRFDLHPVLRVSFAVHQHYLRQYIQPTDRILEIGAGAGRFTQVLAGISPHITVADISPGQLACNRQQAEALGFAHAVERWVECDVCDLHGHFADEEFDTVVCYGGALSYVYDQADTAIQQMLRVLRPGGVIFLEVMTLWGVVHHALMGVLSIPPEKNRPIIASGDQLGALDIPTQLMHMYRAQEFRALLGRAGLEIEVLTVGAVLSTTWIDQLRDIPEESDTWQYLLEMELEACREPGCLDMGEHLIAVCRKAKEA